jgi:N-acetylglucosamine-6-phosphate deacetylase
LLHCIDLALFGNSLYTTANNQIKVITFAPEVEGAHETLEALHKEIQFSISFTSSKVATVCPIEN